MIPASRISFNDDGTLWLIVDSDPFREIDGRLTAPEYVGDWQHYDRPCDTCGGNKRVGMGVDYSQLHPCPDCIDGRHTFMVEVGPQTIREPHVTVYNEVRSYRVSVIPGMVLPMLALEDGWYPVPSPMRFAYVSTVRAMRVVDVVEPSDTWSGIAPSAAAPGMWAVKLKVAQ